MKTVRTIIIIGLTLVCRLNGLSQFTETYFVDDEIKNGKIYDFEKSGNEIIIAGVGFDNTPGQGYVTKIDTLGNIIWTTLDSNISNPILKIIESDSFIFTESVHDSWNNLDSLEICKVNSLDGTVLWKKTFFEGINARLFFQEVDSTRIVFGYRDVAHVSKIAFINKNSGDTTSTHIVGSGWYSPLSFGSDSSGDFYYSFKDTIYKVSSLDPDSIIWKKTYPLAGASNFQKIYIDTNDSIFLIGKSGGGGSKIICINSVTGNKNWQVINSFIPVGGTCVDFKDHNGFLISTWRHLYVGSGPFYYQTLKVNKSNGTLVWSSEINASTIGAFQSYSGPGESAMSMAIDSMGDIYLTGYSGSSNWGPGCWSIIKVNGSNGLKIWDKIITDKPMVFDRSSQGVGALIINDKLYFVGNLQDSVSEFLTKRTLVELNPSTGGILSKKTLGLVHQFPSKVVDIKVNESFQTITLKQTGRTVDVEMYDYLQNKKWSKRLSQDYMVVGKLIQGRPDGTTLVATNTVLKSNVSPYYSNSVDSVQVYLLNQQGHIIDKESFKPYTSNIELKEFIQDGPTTHLVYTDNNNKLFFRSFGVNGLGMEISSGIYPFYPSISSSLVLNYSLDSFLIFGYSPPQSRVFKVDKASGVKQDAFLLPDFKYIKSMQKSDSNTVLICGSNQQDEDYIARFDFGIMDTLWRKTYNIDSEILTCVNDEDSNSLYIIGIHSDTLFVGKVNQNNGELIWTYEDTTSSNLRSIPTDIIFDKFLGQVIFSGYKSDPSSISDGEKIFITTIDTNGVLINSLIKNRTINEHNEISCLNRHFSGSIWAGGNYNDTLVGKPGILLQTAPCASFFTDVQIVCDSLLWIDGVTYYSDTDTTFYIMVGGASNGCDSIITLNLTVLNTTYFIDTLSSCDSLSWINGITYYSNNTVAKDTLINSVGCDSIVTLNLTISNLSSTYTYVDLGSANYSFNNNSTGNFTHSYWAFGDGTTSSTSNPSHSFNANGTYVVVLAIYDSNVLGDSCISYFTDTINVTGVSNSVQCNAGWVVFADSTTGGVTIVNSSTGTNLTYHWDFGDGDTSNLQFPSHTYTSNGPFNLCLTVDDGNGCSDTYCDSISSNGVLFKNGFDLNVVANYPLGVQDIGTENEVKIYPNPTSSTLNIETENFKINKILIRDNSGKVVKTIISNFDVLNVESLATGVYYIELIGDEESVSKKFIKQ